MALLCLAEQALLGIFVKQVEQRVLQDQLAHVAGLDHRKPLRLMAGAAGARKSECQSKKMPDKKMPRQCRENCAGK